MTLLPKPRGFWDYALFALIISGFLAFFFWLGASNGISWADVALACAAAVFGVLATVLCRRAEKAAWITKPTRRSYLLAMLGAIVLVFGAVYVDAYLLHRRDITSGRIWRDIVIAVGFLAMTWWSSRKRFSPGYHSPEA
jgi:hypothetical protein